MRRSTATVFAFFALITISLPAPALAGGVRVHNPLPASSGRFFVVSLSLQRHMQEFARELRAADHKRAVRRAHRIAARKRARAVRLAARRAVQQVVSASPVPMQASSAGVGGVSGTMAAIAQCESGGNPAAVSAGGTYRGKYQFDQQTWQSVGGSGDPAAASEAEQDQRAAQLYAQAGPGRWPVCGR